MKFTTNGMQISQPSQTDTSERRKQGMDGMGWRDVRTDIRLAMGRMLGIVKFAGECFSSTPPKEAPGTEREAKKKKHNKSPGIMRLPVAPWSIACKGVCVCGIVGAYRSAPNRTFEPNFMSYQRQIATSLRSGHNTWLYGHPAMAKTKARLDPSDNWV